MTTSELKAAINKGDAGVDGASFEAIVVGGGAAGGLAASLLCDAGLKVLLLDAGYLPPVWQAPWRRITNFLVRSIANPALIKVIPWRIINLGREALRIAGRVRQPIQTQTFAW